MMAKPGITRIFFISSQDGVFLSPLSSCSLFNQWPCPLCHALAAKPWGSTKPLCGPHWSRNDHCLPWPPSHWTRQSRPPR